MVKLVRERLWAAHSRQRSYVDPKKSNHILRVGDRVFLKVSPMKWVMRFRKKGKLALHYIGPYKVLKRVGSVTFELALSLDFSLVHPIFHVSLLKPYAYDPSYVLEP